MTYYGSEHFKPIYMRENEETPKNISFVHKCNII